ncbi:unnamed protein product [Pedinophyceae sp. YPF-701]|nr:unnamed protein product [Pedinophyceae sp. YPF-701]
MSPAPAEQFKMDAVKKAVVGLPSAAALVSALVNASDECSPPCAAELCKQVEACVTEARKAGPLGPTQRAGAAGAQVDGRVDVSEALSVIEDISVSTPRGRFRLCVLPDAMVLCGKSNDVRVPLSAITHVVILDELPRSQGMNSKDRVLVLLSLDTAADVRHGKSGPLPVVLFSTLASAAVSCRAPKAAPGTPPLNGQPAVVLCQILAAMGVPEAAFLSPDLGVFKSSKGAHGISAYRGTSDGFLFFLQGAIVFAERPALVLPVKRVRCVGLSRTGAASATFDMVVYVRGGDAVEFTALGKEEMPAVMAYLEDRKIRLGEPAGDESGGEEEGAAAGAESGDGGETDDSDDEEDDDFDPNAKDSEFDDSDVDAEEVEIVDSDDDAGKTGKRRAAKLRASLGGSGGGAAAPKAAKAPATTQPPAKRPRRDSDYESEGSDDDDMDDYGIRRD